MVIGAIIYCDGSYNIKTHNASYATLIMDTNYNVIDNFSGVITDAGLCNMRNVGGEIIAAKLGMVYCEKNDIKIADIFYDYKGIENWCTKKWKANNPYTRAYSVYYDELRHKGFIFRFHHVKGHSGNKYNDIVDRMAKDALGIK